MPKGRKKVKRVKKARCLQDDKLLCPYCNVPSTAKEWDKTTYKLCDNRDMKRDYKSITDRITLRGGNPENKYYYMCPKCGRIVSGNYILRYKDDTDTEQSEQ